MQYTFIRGAHNETESDWFPWISRKYRHSAMNNFNRHPGPWGSSEACGILLFLFTPLASAVRRLVVTYAADQILAIAGEGMARMITRGYSQQSRERRRTM
jgi:hypothetical protein